MTTSGGKWGDGQVNFPCNPGDFFLHGDSQKAVKLWGSMMCMSVYHPCGTHDHGSANH